MSRLKIRNNTSAIPSLVYSCEMLALKQREVRRLKTAEMKLTSSLLDHRRA